MEVDGLDELRLIGIRILEFVETLGDESEFGSMNIYKGSLLVELSLEFEGIGGKMVKHDLVSILGTTFTVAALRFSVSKISIF